MLSDVLESGNLGLQRNENSRFCESPEVQIPGESSRCL